MVTFILAFSITVLFLGFYYKSTFWNQKFNVFFYGLCASTLVSLIVNLSVRSSLDKTVTIFNMNQITMSYVPNSELVTDSLGNVDSTKTPVGHTYDWSIEDVKLYKFKKLKGVKQTQTHIIFSTDTTRNPYVTYLTYPNKYNKEIGIYNTRRTDDTYFVKGKTLNAYYLVLNVDYVINSIWVNSFMGYPEFDSAKVIVLPENEYAKLPLELTKELPKHFNIETVLNTLN